tara:strand:- start:2529 stop:2798 length:270 start_codon:yes stop_codon:yes gene_type:complete
MSKTYSHAEVMELVADAKVSERLIWQGYVKEKHERVKVVMDALIRHHENQCHWQGQDPKDHETYYEEGYPEINKIFENHYKYVEPNFDE